VSTPSFSSLLGLPAQEPAAAEEATRQVVVFRVGPELHACDVLLVEEVVSDTRVHPLPDLPAEVLGVIRLRGALVPVLDVAPALGLRLEAGRTPAVLVVEAPRGRLGIAVDEVRDVASIPLSAIQPAPGRAGEQDEQVLGVARVGEALVTLLDLPGILRNFTLSLREPQ